MAPSTRNAHDAPEGSVFSRTRGFAPRMQFYAQFFADVSFIARIKEMVFFANSAKCENPNKISGNFFFKETQGARHKNPRLFRTKLFLAFAARLRKRELEREEKGRSCEKEREKKRE